jgi:hypothetical protein
MDSSPCGTKAVEAWIGTARETSRAGFETQEHSSALFSAEEQESSA